MAICGMVVRADVATRRDAFQFDARTARPMLSQRASQRDAILAMLMLLDPAPSANHPSTRLPALYAQLLKVWRCAADVAWPEASLALADDLVLSGAPASIALRIELDHWVPWSDWPCDREGAVKAALVHGTQWLPLQPGREGAGWHGGVTPGFVFE